jgi:pterin-4a-carbinolamine dehydratase
MEKVSVLMQFFTSLLSTMLFQNRGITMESPKFPFFITFTFIAHVGHMTLNMYLINFELWKNSKLTTKFLESFVTEWKRIELESSGHLINHNPFMKWEKVELGYGGHLVDHNISIEWGRVELKPSSHVMDHNPFIEWEWVELELNGHMMDCNPLIEWDKVELKFCGHLMDHNLFKKWERVEWIFY